MYFKIKLGVKNLTISIRTKLVQLSFTIKAYCTLCHQYKSYGSIIIIIKSMCNNCLFCL